ncbi:MAG: hypothetical protein PVS3B3_05400 [Ktedonobacteraceae bacterium]
MYFLFLRKTLGLLMDSRQAVVPITRHVEPHLDDTTYEIPAVALVESLTQRFLDYSFTITHAVQAIKPLLMRVPAD